MKTYYVYSLTDPRNNQIFYIGKGTGERYNSHLKESKENLANSTKSLKIRNILDAGFEVGIDIIFNNLSEIDAYHLEKVLVSRLGRIIDKSGPLTNIAYGGEWKSEGRIFIKDEDFDISFEFEKLSKLIKNKIIELEQQQSSVSIEYPASFNTKSYNTLRQNRSKGLTLEELKVKKNKLLKGEI